MSGPAEVTGLDQCIAYAEHLAAEAGQHGPEGNEAYLAHLAVRRITGEGLSSGRAMQDAFAAAATAADAHAEQLTRQKTVQEAYDQAGDAGDKAYLTGDNTSTPDPAAASSGSADTKGTPMTDTPPAPPAPPAVAGQSKGGFFRCDGCGYVLETPAARGNVVAIEPAGCPNCRTSGVTFTPTKVFYPDRPSDDAIERDTRDVEAQIRATYQRLAEAPGIGVPLADLRAALPADLDRETVDAALYKLGAHSDVSLTPYTGQQQATLDNQQAALARGGKYDHTMRIYQGSGHRMPDTLQRIRSTSRVQAASILAPLPWSLVSWLAERMGVEVCDGTEELRERVAERADRNQREERADAQQGQRDGTLLYRADTEPEWVATWTDDDRRQVAAAAARLQRRAATQEMWAYVKDRADRWATAATPTS
jgi:hypothetical protein